MQSGRKRQRNCQINPKINGKIRLNDKVNFLVAVVIDLFPGMH